MTTTLHTSSTAEGQRLSAVEGGPTLYDISYLGSELRKPWMLDIHYINSVGTKVFRTMEGAQYYALHLEAEKDA